MSPKTLGMILVPLVAAVLVYAGTTRGDFVHDDNLQIVQNPWVKEIRYLPRVLSESVWAFRSSQSTNYYRPVQMGLYNLLWVGSGGNPVAFHVANIVLHLCTIAALALLILQLSRDRLLACGAALVFAVHPVNTEAVAWIACVPELTYALFSLVCLLLHVRSWDGGRAYRAMALVAFALAVLSKETGMVVLGLIGLLELWIRPAHGADRRPRWLHAALVLLPYAAIGMAYIVLRFRVLSGFAPLLDHELTVVEALINAPPLFLSYFRVMFWPVNLLVHHVFVVVPSATDPQFLLGSAAVGLCAALVLSWARRRPDLAFAGALAVFPLLPVLYVPALGSNAFAERYTYLPTAGLAWIVLGLVAAALVRKGRAAPASRAVLVLAVVIALPFGAMTVARNRDWLTTERLARVTLRDEPRATDYYVVLGNWYEKEGRDEEALATYAAGVAAVPQSIPLQTNHVNVSLRLGRITADEAIARYEALGAGHPLLYELHAVIGDALLQARRFDDAEKEFLKAIDLNPHDPMLYNRLAVGYVESGRLEEARQALEQALVIDPEFALARDNLRRLEAHTGGRP